MGKQRITTRDIEEVIRILKRESKKWDVPVVKFTSSSTGDPFRILISTILSLRTKDEVTAGAIERLFSHATTPKQMLELGEEKISELIYPVGFYRNKAKTIIEVSKVLVERYNSMVPDDLDELLSIKGVGRKTANLVITLAYGKPGICVDTHVHRISNRLGYISTKKPFETEMELRKKLPRKYWIDFNHLMVALGQYVCKPISPLCSKCPVEHLCKKVGVTRNR